MTRRIVALIVALMLALGAAALAETETEYLGNMMVDNCDEWVSLRDGPGTGCERLVKVPLYAVVTDCERGPLTGDFIYCCYDGQWGYILAKYLVPWADPEAPGPLLDARVGDFRLRAERSYEDEAEHLRLTCEDAAGNTVWSREEKTDEIGQVDLLTAFMGGTAQDPLVMVYNADKALFALDPSTGEERWQVSDYLGAGNSWAVDDFGMLYIGGFDGPDPVAIDGGGNVLWRADSEGCFRLYQMELRDNALWCWYEGMDDGGEQSGEVIFSLDGKIIEKRYDR